MGSIIERARKDGTTSYQAMVKIPGGKAAVKSFDSQIMAQKFINAIELDRKAITTAAKKLAKKQKRAPLDLSEQEKIDQFKNAWLKNTLRLFVLSDRCSNRNRCNMPTILRKIGDVKIGEINKKWVKDYLARLRVSKTYRGTFFTWGTLASHMRAMSLAIRWHAEELDVPIWPLPFSTKLLPDNWATKRSRRMSRAEELAIIGRLRQVQRSSKHHWRLLFRMALETAARQQELVLAEWKEFDLERKVWTIPAEHIKTRDSRVVPLSKAAMRCMKILKLISDPNDSRVFHGVGMPPSVSNMFHRYVAEAGIKNLTFHDLRHEAISRIVLFKRQLSVFEIMKIVGHRSLEMLNLYANLRGDELVDRMN